MNISFRLIILLGMLSLSSLSFASTQQSIQMIDKARERIIPVEIYEGVRQEDLPIVIINHGYSVKNTEYSFLANALAIKGYFVVSIQHDLPNDVPLPKSGNLFERRKPLWVRGVQNILFVIDKLKNENPGLNLDQVILIGHSNGGDIAMMFASQHPEMVSKAISLDSLRYPFPRKDIPILHFSANDTQPDAGVIPEQGVQTILIEDAKHIDLCDRGSVQIKNKISESVLKFLST